MPLFWTDPKPPTWYERHGSILLAAILLILEGIAAYQWTR